MKYDFCYLCVKECKHAPSHNIPCDHAHGVCSCDEQSLNYSICKRNVNDRNIPMQAYYWESECEKDSEEKSRYVNSYKQFFNDE